MFLITVDWRAARLHQEHLTNEGRMVHIKPPGVGVGEGRRIKSQCREKKDNAISEAVRKREAHVPQMPGFEKSLLEWISKSVSKRQNISKNCYCGIRRYS